jgi:hypothetical protein
MTLLSTISSGFDDRQALHTRFGKCFAHFV